MLSYNSCRDIKNIDLPTGRVYDTPAGKFPSVTTVLSATADKTIINKWIAKIGQEEADRILKAAAYRGTKLHEYLEEFLQTYETPTLITARKFVSDSLLTTEPEFIQVMVKNIMKILISYKYTSIAQEFAVWDTDLKLAGRCDNLGYINNKLTLIDFKTSRKQKELKFVRDYFLQATAYCKSHNQMFTEQITRFMIIIAVEDGTTQVFTGNPTQYVSELRYRVRKFYDKNNN